MAFFDLEHLLHSWRFKGRSNDLNMPLPSTFLKAYSFLQKKQWCVLLCGNTVGQKITLLLLSDLWKEKGGISGFRGKADVRLGDTAQFLVGLENIHKICRQLGFGIKNEMTGVWQEAKRSLLSSSQWEPGPNSPNHIFFEGMAKWMVLVFLKLTEKELNTLGPPPTNKKCMITELTVHLQYI